MKKWNNKGTDKILSVYWFAILFIVVGGVVYMTVLYYGEPYDIREIEANFLINHVADCLSQGGILVDDWNINENFLEKCNLNFNVEDVYGWKEQEQYYLEIDFQYFKGGSARESLIVGNSNLKDFCDKGLTCVERSFYTLDKEDNQYIIKILSVVRKTEKNVQ